MKHGLSWLRKILPHVFIPNDNSILLEWIFKGTRFGISLENRVSESGWFFVTRDKVMCGYLLKPWCKVQ